jgi:hypothetical protein
MMAVWPRLTGPGLASRYGARHGRECPETVRPTGLRQMEPECGSKRGKIGPKWADNPEKPGFFDPLDT